MLVARHPLARGLSIRVLTFVLLVVGLAMPLAAQQLTVRHLAGPDGGFGGEDGAGTSARFYNPTGIAADSSGNLFVIERDNHTLRKITPSGEVKTLVGIARYGGSQDGVRAQGGLAVPYDLALDATGTMYVTEVGWDRVKKVTPDGIVSVLAGSGAYPGGSTNGQGTAAQFNDPHGIAVAADGTIYVADNGNHTIRKITPGGLVSTLAGVAGSQGILDGTGTGARFRYPEDIAIAANGDLYVSDSGNYRIRKVTPAGVVTTVAGSSTSGLVDATGTAARFITPRGLAFDANGVLWIADNSFIRKMTPAGAVTTVAGSAISIAPSQITVMSGGDLYFTDLVDHTVRRMTQAGAVTLMYGKPAPAGHVDAAGTSARFQLSDAGAAMGPDGNLYVGDGPTIRKITPAGVVTTFAGSSYGSNDGTLATAKFWSPIAALTFDASGVLWVADSGNRTIRRIGTDGQVTTYAGLAGASGTADGVGSSARFDNPHGIAVDGLGNLYVSEYIKHTIRKIAPGGVVTTFAGTAGSSGMVDATGTAARFYQPGNLTIDPSGNLYVADQANYRIRKITPGAVVTTFAGGATGSVWDGTGTAARFGFPYGLTFTPDGNLWVMDSSAVRRITPARQVTTVAGRRGDSYDNGQGSTDGTGSVARFYSPTAIAAGSDGTLYIADNYNNCIRSARPASGEIATIDAPTGLTGEARQLDAVGGNATSYQWTIVRRPANSTATLSDPAARNPIFVPDVADVYRFRLTATGPDGMSVTEVDLTATCENGVPVVTSTVNPSCVGQTVTLDAGPGSAWLWSTGETTRTITVTLTQNKWFSGTVWDANGCATSFSHIQDVQSDLITANVYAAQACYGTPATMHVDTLVSGGIKTYDWSWSVNSTGPWTPIPNATGEEFAIDYSYFSPGNYYVKCTVTPSCGTPKTGQSTLYIYSLPSATITASGPTRFCQGGSVTLTAPSSAQYQWSNGATTRSITVAASGTFTVRTYNNICWSGPSAAVTVTVDPAAATPVITASGPTTFCQGGSVTLTASSGASYLWSNGATTQSTVIQAGGSYTVTVTDANGCSAISAPVAVTVQPLPNAAVTVSGPTSFCAGGSVTLTATDGTSWLWSNGATTQSIVVTASGSYSATITGANGCSTTSSPTTVTVYAPPSVTITPSGPTTFCQGGSVTLTASSGQSYLWSNGATTQSIVAGAAGSYSVTVTDANGCSGSSPATEVTVNAAPEPPVVSASGPTTFCEGGSVTLSAPAGFTYLWSNGETTQSIAVTAAGSYSVTVTNGSGCPATSEATTVTVNANPAAPAITASGPTTFCEGGSVTLTAPAGFTYLWSTGATAQSIAVTATGSYSVTVTNASGCSATSATTTVTVNAVPATPAVSAGGPTTFCEGGSVTLTAPDGFTYLWSNGATTQSIEATATGSYSVTVTNANGCSATSAPTAVTVNANPVATIAASGPTSFCEGGSVTLTASSGASYLWSNGATTQSIAATVTGSYSVTVTNASGCSATSAATAVTVNATPVATISAGGPTTFCEGGSVTLTASAGTSYLWSNGATTQSINATTSGSYSVTVTNASGCSATSAATTVTVNANPVATITAGGPTTFCTGGSVMLTASAGATYLWSNGATTQSINATNAGSYTVTVTNASGCSDTSDATTVTVNANPVATIAAGGPTTFCEGGSVTLTASAGTSYLWSNGATTQSIHATTSGSYTVTVTNASGCSAASDATTVTVNANPSATITANGPTTFCAGGSVTLTASAGTSYLWSNGATTQSINATTSGSYTVTVTNASGCSATSVATTVTVNANPTATITAGGPTTFCAGGSVTLTASAGTSYLWSNGATTQSISPTTSGSYSVTVTNASGCSATSPATAVTVDAKPATPAITAGGPTTFCTGGSVMLTAPAGFTYLWSTGATTQSINVATTGSYTVTVTNASGCSATSDATTVTVNANPSATITAGGPTTFCAGGSVTLTASAGTSYLWSNGATTQSINVATSGSYTVTVTNASGCSTTSAATTVTVNAKPATPAITAGGPTTFCTGGSVTLTAPAGFTYLWSNGATTQSITATTSGSYTVTVTNASGCSTTSAATTVTVNAKPATPAITAGGPTTFCTGGSVTLTAPAGFTYLWSNGATTQSINATTSGSYTVTVTNASGCSATSAATTVTVNANPVATITAGGPTTFCEGGSVTLTASAGTSYLWSNGATTASINVSTSGSYTVTVTNASGCSATSAATTVTVNAKPATPAITAGGPTTFCAGGSVTLTAPAGFTYLWSTGATTQSINATTAGSYSVTVTNASGCSATSAATAVTVNAATSISAQPQSVTIARNAAATLSVTASGTGTLTYQWYRGTSPSTATPVSGATASTYTTPKLAKGTYTYWVRVTGSCGVVNSNTATISVP